MTSSGPALVEMTGVDKRFGTTRALRGVDLSLGAGPVPRPGRPQRRREVDPRLDPVRPPRAGRGHGAVRRRARAPRRRHRALARVDRHGLPALDDRAGPVGRRERLPRQHAAGWSAGGSCAAGRATSCASGGSTSPPETPCRELSVEQLQIVEIARALARGRQVRAARRAHRGPGAPGRPAAVRAGPAAHRGRRGRPVHLAPPGRGLRDLPGRRRAARRRAGAGRAHGRPQQGRPGGGHGRRRPGRPGPARQAGGHPRSTRPRRGDVVLAVDDLTADSARGPPVRGVTAGAGRARSSASPACSAPASPPSGASSPARRATPAARSGCAGAASRPGGAASPSAPGSATSRRTAAPRGSSRTWASPRTSR